MPTSWADRAPTRFTTYLTVRLEAPTAKDARRHVVEALGREPKGLTVAEGQPR